MATINVRLKDATGNILHPETDWSVVQNKPSYFPTSWDKILFKPSIEKVASGEQWDVSNSGYSLSISGDGGVNITSGSGKTSVGGVSGVNITSSFNTITLHAGGTSAIIKVGDKNTNYQDTELSNYPINWKAIQKVTSSSMLIGVYHTSPGINGATAYMDTIGFMCTSQNTTNFYYIDPSTGGIKLGNSSNFTSYMNLYQ